MDKRYADYKDHYKTKSPSRAAHLAQHQFKPGQSGNPTGRKPATPSVVERLKAWLQRHPEDVDKIVEALIGLAKTKGPFQLTAIDRIIDRLDGKPTETRRIEGSLPVLIEFVPARALLAQGQSLLQLPNPNIIEAEYQDLSAISNDTLDPGLETDEPEPTSLEPAPQKPAHRQFAEPPEFTEAVAKAAGIAQKLRSSLNVGH